MIFERTRPDASQKIDVEAAQRAANEIVAGLQILKKRALHRDNGPAFDFKISETPRQITIVTYGAIPDYQGLPLGKTETKAIGRIDVLPWLLYADMRTGDSVRQTFGEEKARKAAVGSIITAHTRLAYKAELMPTGG